VVLKSKTSSPLFLQICYSLSIRGCTIAVYRYNFPLVIEDLKSMFGVNQVKGIGVVELIPRTRKGLMTSTHSSLIDTE